GQAAGPGQKLPGLREKTGRTGHFAILRVPMTLRRKMAVQIAAMIVGLLLVSAASLWGLNALYEGYDLAQDDYQELRYINEVRTHLQMARTLLKLADPQREDAVAGLLSAQTQFDLYAAPPASGAGTAPASAAAPRERSPLSFMPFLGQGGGDSAAQSYQAPKAAVRTGLGQALAQLRDADAHAKDPAAAGENDVDVVQRVLDAVTDLSAQIRD